MADKNILIVLLVTSFIDHGHGGKKSLVPDFEVTPYFNATKVLLPESCLPYTQPQCPRVPLSLVQSMFTGLKDIIGLKRVSISTHFVDTDETQKKFSQ